MEKQVILVGGGGHCKSCIDVIETTGLYKIAGIIDVAEKVGTDICGYKIIGTDEQIDRLSNSEYDFLITVGQITNPNLRLAIYSRLKLAKKTLALIISPNALVSKHSKVGKGSIILHGAKINAGCSIGENCIINTNANVEHDCIIGNHTHISTNAVVNGDCRVGNYTFIGSNAVLVNGMSIASSVVIGAGSVVNRSITEPGIYAGNPCRKLKLK